MTSREVEGAEYSPLTHDIDLHHEDDDVDGEKGLFLGRRNSDAFNWRRVVLRLLPVIVCTLLGIGAGLAIFLPQHCTLPASQSSNRASTADETLASSAAATSSPPAPSPPPYVKKITGRYGRGTWTTPQSVNDTNNNLDRAVQIHIAHAAKHGHEQVIQTMQLFGTQVEDAYSKIGSIMLQNYLEMNKQPEERAKWIFWHDVDTVITNSEISLDTFVSDIEGENINIVYSEDHNGLQAGAFFLRVSEWTSLFLASVLAMGKTKGHEPMFFREQEGMRILLMTNDFYKSAAAVVPQRWFDAYPTSDNPQENTEELAESYAKPGYFMVHVVGFTKYRPGCFTQLLDAGEGQDPAWQSTTAAAQLKEEVAAFWRAHLGKA